jgi:phosphatidylinositol glycan class S
MSVKYSHSPQAVHSHLSMPSSRESQLTLKDPSKLIYQADKTRRSILAAYWIAILLALPLWWYTTAVERLSLPASRVFAHSAKELRLPIHLKLDATSTEDATSIAPMLQAFIKETSLAEPDRWKELDVHIRSRQHTGTSL